MRHKEGEEMAEKYVLNLIEDRVGTSKGEMLGYWDGKVYRMDGVSFPGVIDNKKNEMVKVYTSKKRAENAVGKLKDKFTFVTSAEIEKLD